MKRPNMLRIVAVAAVVFISTGFMSAEVPVDSVPRQTVGLVLSGGGAKGIAHIGVLQAFEENDIPIDYITGTSMGAIVGGLYAAGYTPQEMLDLILSRGFSYWSTGEIDPNLKYYFTAEQPSPEFFSKSIATRADSLAADSTAVPASLISPLPMSYAFMQLFAPYTAQCSGDFNKLFVPFRCCASDVAAHHKVVLSKGDFADAIRSSMSYPIVFQPTNFEGMLLYDGGLYDNFPADVMKEDFNPDFVIGVDVSTKDLGPQTSLMDQLGTLIVQGGSYYLDPTNGIMIDFDLNRFGLLDFPQAQEIYEIGYNKAMEMIDSIKGRVTGRVPAVDVAKRRAEFKKHTPQLAFDDVYIYGAPQSQVKFLRSLFPETGDGESFSLENATASYYRAISTGQLRDFQPHAFYNDTTGLFSLRLKASVKDDFKVGVGGYLTSSSSSYLYFSAGYNKLSFNALSAKLSAWVGQSYLAAMFNGRLFLPTKVPSALEIEGVASRTNYYNNDKMFFSDVPSFVHGYQYFGRLKWGMAAGSLGKFEAGVGDGHLHASFYQPITEIESEPYRSRCNFNLAEAFVRYTSSTLSDVNYPISGRYYNFTAMGVMGNYRQTGDPAFAESAGKLHPKWIQAEFVTRNYFELGRHFSFGIESDIMASSRKLLPGYNASILAAPGYYPTPSSYNVFNPAFRANSFAAASIVPVYRFNTNLSARLHVSGFVPIRKIIAIADGGAAFEGHWIGRPEMFTELSLCYSTPVGTISAYGNYATSPERFWNVGVSFGVFMRAPDFLR